MVIESALMRSDVGEGECLLRRIYQGGRSRVSLSLLLWFLDLSDHATRITSFCFLFFRQLIQGLCIPTAAELAMEKQMYMFFLGLEKWLKGRPLLLSVLFLSFMIRESSVVAHPSIFVTDASAADYYNQSKVGEGQRS